MLSLAGVKRKTRLAVSSGVLPAKSDRFQLAQAKLLF